MTQLSAALHQDFLTYVEDFCEAASNIEEMSTAPDIMKFRAEDHLYETVQQEETAIAIDMPVYAGFGDMDDDGNEVPYFHATLWMTADEWGFFARGTREQLYSASVALRYEDVLKELQEFQTWEAPRLVYGIGQENLPAYAADHPRRTLILIELAAYCTDMYYAEIEPDAEQRSHETAAEHFVDDPVQSTPDDGIEDVSPMQLRVVPVEDAIHFLDSGELTMAQLKPLLHLYEACEHYFAQLDTWSLETSGADVTPYHAVWEDRAPFAVVDIWVVQGAFPDERYLFRLWCSIDNPSYWGLHTVVGDESVDVYHPAAETGNGAAVPYGALVADGVYNMLHYIEEHRDAPSAAPQLILPPDTERTVFEDNMAKLYEDVVAAFALLPMEQEVKALRPYRQSLEGEQVLMLDIVVHREDSIAEPLKITFWVNTDQWGFFTVSQAMRGMYNIFSLDDAVTVEDAQIALDGYRAQYMQQQSDMKKYLYDQMTVDAIQLDENIQSVLSTQPRAAVMAILLAGVLNHYQSSDMMQYTVDLGTYSQLHLSYMRQEHDLYTTVRKLEALHTPVDTEVRGDDGEVFYEERCSAGCTDASGLPETYPCSTVRILESMSQQYF